MTDLINPLEVSITAVVRLRQSLVESKSRQVRNSDERMLMKATAHTWFQAQRGPLLALAAEPAFQAIDKSFAILLECADQTTIRTRCVVLLHQLRSDLVKLRSAAVTRTAAPTPGKRDFARLIADAGMRRILERRWEEALLCINAGARLAATVMMGALLEAILLARRNHLQNKAPVFTASAAPKDPGGKTRPLKDWGLKNYLDVANELNWIRHSAKDVGDVLRDYRNYVHPEKEHSHAVTIDGKDTNMFLTIFCSLAEQVVGSVCLREAALAKQFVAAADDLLASLVSWSTLNGSSRYDEP